MIQQFIITNSRNDSLPLVLENPYLNGIAVINVTGIGPEGAKINTTDIINSDVSIFNTARRDLRNIVFTLKPFQCEGYTNVERTRMNIYNYFPLKDKIKIQCITTEKSIYIYGYVEKNEPNIFQKEVTVQLSIICPDPIWKGTKDSQHILSGLSLFEFPFSNEAKNYLFYAKWKDANKFTWNQIAHYGWKWKQNGDTIGKASSLKDRYERLLKQQPIDKDKINTIVEQIYKIDPENYLQVFPIN